MAYDEGLAERIRGVLDERLDVAEKKMFGGIAFMMRGHMCVGVVKGDLMVHVDPEAYDARPAAARPQHGLHGPADEGLCSSRPKASSGTRISSAGWDTACATPHRFRQGPRSRNAARRRRPAGSRR
jgi:hypothetical protein